MCRTLIEDVHGKRKDRAMADALWKSVRVLWLFSRQRMVLYLVCVAVCTLQLGKQVYDASRRLKRVQLRVEMLRKQKDSTIAERDRLAKVRKSFTGIRDLALVGNPEPGWREFLCGKLVFPVVWMHMGAAFLQAVHCFLRSHSWSPTCYAVCCVLCAYSSM